MNRNNPILAALQPDLRFHSQEPWSKDHIRRSINVMEPLLFESVERGADLVLIPEFCTGAAAVWNLSPPGKALQWFMDFAKEHEIFIAPSSYVRNDKGDKYNAVILINRDGQIEGLSGKKHLYYTDCNLGKAKRHMEFPVFPTDCGNLAFGVCEDMDNFDTGFISRLRGAEILAIPSRQPAPTYLANYITLAQAMASQNALFVAAIGEGHSPFSTTAFCGPKLDWDPRSGKNLTNVDSILQRFISAHDYSRDSIEKLGRELCGRNEGLVTATDKTIYKIGRRLQAVIADRTAAMVLMAEIELEWYRDVINVEPPLSEICTPADVDKLALNTIVHDFVYSRYEMPVADYIRFMAPYSVDKRIRRLTSDIERGAVEPPRADEVERLLDTLEAVDSILKSDGTSDYLKSELSIGSFDVVKADLNALRRIREYLKSL